VNTQVVHISALSDTRPPRWSLDFASRLLAEYSVQDKTRRHDRATAQAKAPDFPDLSILCDNGQGWPESNFKTGALNHSTTLPTVGISSFPDGRNYAENLVANILRTFPEYPRNVLSLQDRREACSVARTPESLSSSNHV
jgi:hypothetical protein